MSWLRFRGWIFLALFGPALIWYGLFENGGGWAILIGIVISLYAWGRFFVRK